MRAGGHKERKNLKTRPLGEGKSQFCYVVYVLVVLIISVIV